LVFAAGGNVCLRSPANLCAAQGGGSVIRKGEKFLVVGRYDGGGVSFHGGLRGRRETAELERLEKEKGNFLKVSYADKNFLLIVTARARPGQDDLVRAVAVVTVDVQNPSVESGFGRGKGHAHLALGVGSQV